MLHDAVAISTAAAVEAPPGAAGWSAAAGPSRDVVVELEGPGPVVRARQVPGRRARPRPVTPISADGSTGDGTERHRR